MERGEGSTSVCPSDSRRRPQEVLSGDVPPVPRRRGRNPREGIGSREELEVEVVDVEPLFMMLGISEYPSTIVR